MADSKIYFDKKNNRLVYIKKESSPKFWDNKWRTSDDQLKKVIMNGRKNFFMRQLTRKYVKQGGKILEGGCGTGQHVYAFNNWGYDSYGIDFAKSTIKAVNRVFPSLKIIEGDVNSLPYSSGFFDACWSLGVIEHFYGGYEQIVREMERVVKTDGYIFVSFPVMSGLRKLKASHKYYPELSKDVNLKNFYQFALNENQVINDFRIIGLKLVGKRYLSGLKGLKDEVAFMRFSLQKLYDSKNIFFRVCKKTLSICLARMSPHMVLLIFKKL
ncbi:MAG: class I SAM-dependent methyltransferase [archaeon]